MRTTAEYDAQLLIVDDDRASIDSLRRSLRRGGFTNVFWTTDPREAVQLCLWHQPDLLLLDLHMPYLSGEELLSRLRSEFGLERLLPAIMLTGDASLAAKRRTFEAGAQDFISKPYDGREVVLRIRNQLDTLRLNRELLSQKEELEAVVAARTRSLKDAQLELLDRLARAAEYRDDDTGEHAQRVGKLAAQIGVELGLDAGRVELIWRAAALHDVGKIGISDTILLKPGKLTPEEMDTMRKHVSIGAEILSGGESKYLQVAERIALTHHERWDGTGYLGLSGEAIPLEGRIVAVADVFDALTHARPYKAAWSIADAVQYIEEARGTHFDPVIVDAFLKVTAGDSGALSPQPLVGSDPPEPSLAPTQILR